jgi:golgi pH regulator
MGYVFSIYCIFKIIVSGYNVIFASGVQGDSVTNALNIFSENMGWTFDIEFWATQVSFFLIGCMSVISIRGILLQFAKVSLS